MSEHLLLNAVSSGDIRLVSTIIVESNVDINAINANGSTGCHIAADLGLVSIMELLLSFGSDPNIQMKAEMGGSTPLHIAVAKGYRKLVETLLNHYADPNIQDSQGFTPLHIASRKGLTDICKLLVSKGCCTTVLDAQGKSAAYWASDYGHLDVCELLPEIHNYDYLDYLQREKKGGNGNITVIAKEPPKIIKKGRKKTSR